ncbi:MAG: hypothetical protein XD41_0189 [Desulfonauticus sp. 38_4375]|nr:MAG: hypothetical protein XD41_0189 [Desulfonauticus sp. 38_4375]
MVYSSDNIKESVFNQFFVSSKYPECWFENVCNPDSVFTVDFNLVDDHHYKLVVCWIK